MDNVATYVCVQEPMDAVRDKDVLDCFDGVVWDEPNPKGAPIPFTRYRYKAMELAAEHEYLWFADDDFVFRNPSSSSTRFNKPVEEYYNDVLEYLDDNLDVGVLMLKGYFGGVAWGYDIHKNPKNGLVSTAVGGWFARNIGVEKMVEPDERDYVGACFECLAGYNVMRTGLNFAKRFNCPNKYKRADPSKFQANNDNISYADTTITANIQGHIRRKYNDPKWSGDRPEYPRDIKRILRIW